MTQSLHSATLSEVKVTKHLMNTITAKGMFTSLVFLETIYLSPAVSEYSKYRLATTIKEFAKQGCINIKHK